MPDANVFRPSIMFGPEDDFFNRFAFMARLLPALPLIGGGETRFQPVFVGDVAEAIARAVDGNVKPGTTYEIGGPEVRTFKQLMEYVLAVTERKRLLVPLPFALAKFQARFLQFLPKPPLTPDQVELLKSDNVVSRGGGARRPHAEGAWHRRRPRWKRWCRPISGASARPDNSRFGPADTAAAGNSAKGADGLK